MHEIVRSVPPEQAKRRAVKGRRYPYEQLGVGDMFFVPNRPRNNLMPHTSLMGSRLGRKFSTRHVYMRKVDAKWVPCNDGDPGAVLGIAVYRIA